jgi:hypothetical protein
MPLHFVPGAVIAISFLFLLFLGKVWGSDRVQSLLTRRFEKSAKDRLQEKFEPLHSLDQDTKEKLRPLALAHEIRVANSNFFDTTASLILLGGGYVVLFMAISRTNADWLLISEFVAFVLWPIIAIIPTLRGAKINSDAKTFDGFLDLLFTLEEKEGSWGTVDLKNDLVLKLETIATSIQQHLGRQIQPGDQRTRFVIRDQGTQIANGVRGLKAWVLVPRPDTRYHLLQRVKDDLTRTAYGHWDLMERLPIEGLARSLAGGIFEVGRSLLVAAIAPAALWLLQQSPMKLSGNILTGATAVVASISLVYVLLAIDPSFPTRIQAVKELKGMIGK